MSLSSYVSSLATRVAQEFKTIRTELAGKVSTSDSRLTDQRTPLNNSVTSAKIVDGTIVNADISASAAIASSKISFPANTPTNVVDNGDGSFTITF